eukprot:6214259-Pleurochrysis_carterae.AAC.4
MDLLCSQGLNEQDGQWIGTRVRPQQAQACGPQLGIAWQAHAVRLLRRPTRADGSVIRYASKFLPRGAEVDEFVRNVKTMFPVISPAEEM